MKLAQIHGQNDILLFEHVGSLPFLRLLAQDDGRPPSVMACGSCRERRVGVGGAVGGCGGAELRFCSFSTTGCFG